MKLFIKFLFLIFILFVLNITFYYVSGDYRTFVEKLKYNNVNNINSENLENKNNIDNINKQTVNIYDENLNEDYNAPEDIQNIVNEDNIVTIGEEKEEIITENTKKEVILGNNYNNILNLFNEKYDLKNIEVNSKLFELTDEYPDYYYEYYSNELTLYIFPTKTYSEILDIFNYLQEDLPFSINETNNFGEKSFYINLREDIFDNYIRMVISKNGVDFGLKIKKDEYDNIKEILLKLK